MTGCTGVTAPLTDSGYLATDDVTGLRRLLDAGHAAGEETVVVLRWRRRGGATAPASG